MIIPNAKNDAANIGRTNMGWAFEVTGCTIIKTPKKPTITADILQIPMTSLRKIVANKQTKIGAKKKQDAALERETKGKDP